MGLCAAARPSGSVTQLGIEHLAGFKCLDPPDLFCRLLIAVKVVRADPLEVFLLYCDSLTYQFLEKCVSGFPNVDMVTD